MALHSADHKVESNFTSDTPLKCPKNVWCIVQRQDNDIKKQFGSLSDATEDTLIKKGVLVDKIVSFVTGLWVIPSKEKPVVLQLLELAPNVHRIFAILVVHGYMTCIKYDILKCLIDKFCEKELSEELKRFEETFKK